MILKDYNETYAHRMRDKGYLDAYLEACLQESDEAFYIGLRRAVQAHESLYRALSAEGNPSFRTIHKILRALGADESILAHMASAVNQGTGHLNAAKQ